jgi:hypothetical protein
VSTLIVWRAARRELPAFALGRARTADTGLHRQFARERRSSPVGVATDSGGLRAAPAARRRATP